MVRNPYPFERDFQAKYTKLGKHVQSYMNRNISNILISWSYINVLKQLQTLSAYCKSLREKRLSDFQCSKKEQHKHPETIENKSIVNEIRLR